MQPAAEYNKKKIKRTFKLKKIGKQKSQWFNSKQSPQISWEDYPGLDFPNSKIEKGIISSVNHSTKWKTFYIFDKEKNITTESIIHVDIPAHLSSQIVIWDIVSYIDVEWKNLIIKRENRLNKISRLKWDNQRFSMWKRAEQCLVANIDFWIIVASATKPTFHSNFIDRYNILFQYWNVKPLICITKSDLSELDDPILNRYKNELWIKVIYCSTVSWKGIEELKKEISGKIVVLVWNSWVWKSSLVNHLRWVAESKTQEVNEKYWQWKHTTTSSQLFERMEDSYIIDTPWIRSLELLELKKDDLKYYFTEFEKFTAECKYKDCSHSHEPKCGVKSAVEKWELSAPRYDNYIRILNSLV